MTSPCQVLLIEGDVLLSNILKSRLEMNSLVVSECHSVTTALAMVETLRPRLVIMELNLPDGSGFDLLPQIRLSNAGQAAQIIVLTSYEDPASIKAASQLGANLVLRKSEINANKVALMALSACSVR